METWSYSIVSQRLPAFRSPYVTTRPARRHRRPAQTRCVPRAPDTHLRGDLGQDRLRDAVDLFQHQVQRAAIHVLHGYTQLSVTAGSDEGLRHLGK